MKILDRYLLKTFVATFGSVFFILFLIFIFQTVWLFIGELAGKDLDLALVFKFLVYSMPRIIPLVLPLSVVLASIMTFGGLAENYEFAAIKSSGISLQRAMRTLTIFIILLSIVSFFFANNVIPYAEYKFINFRKDIAQRKPALAIAEGQFSDIGTYNIKVNKKSGENGRLLSGITIHKKAANGDGGKTVIKAKNGELVSNDRENLLSLILNDGYYYEDVEPAKYEEKKKLPFAKSAFQRYTINLDLSKLTKSDDPDFTIANTNTMLNLGELGYTIDSLDKSYSKDQKSFADNSYQRTGMVNLSTEQKFMQTLDTTTRPKIPVDDILKGFTNLQKSDILRVAASNITSNGYSIDAVKMDMEQRKKILNTHWTALWDKFVIAYACLLMFFIGAPLGAIIRKGGLGLPMVFAVGIFIIFHFINTFGKKLAQEDGISPFLGSWMASIVLTPLAILLTYRATNDIGLISFDNVITPIGQFFKKIIQPKSANLSSNVE